MHQTSSLIKASHLGATGRLARTDTDIVLVERTLDTAVLAEAEHRCRRGPVFRYVQEVPIGKGHDVFEGFPAGVLRDQLRRDVPRLVAAWASLTGRMQARVGLALVDSDECRKLHRDYIDLRIVCTYWGPGTWLAPEEVLDRSALGAVFECVNEANRRICSDPSRLVQAGAGDFAFLKGARWKGRSRGAIHRSPAIEAARARRIVLKVDGGVHQ
ncbi:MAG: DUF1826 domain-containing protein [Myxococcota bacterium]